MRKLYHFPLCPYSRKVRILLAEKNLDFKLIRENFWERRREFAQLNHAVQVPVLVEEDGAVYPDSYAICEYLNLKYPQNSYMRNSLKENAEIRRLISWFDNKFYHEVTKYLLKEKVVRYYTRIGEPNSSSIRAAKRNIVTHLEYISYLTEGFKYLLDEHATLADLTAAAHISVVDYLSEVPWESYPKVQEWYARIKSKPSFRPLLADRVPGFIPPKCYVNPDF